MAKTLLDLDETLLNEATSALGTATKKETVTHALRLVVDAARSRRAQGLAELQAIADSGGFDFDLYSDLDR